MSHQISFFKKEKDYNSFWKMGIKVYSSRIVLKTAFPLGETMEVLLQSFKNADQFCIDFLQRVIYLPTNLFKRDIL